MGSSLACSDAVSQDSGRKPCFSCGCIDQLNAKDDTSLKNEDVPSVVEDSIASTPNGSGNVPCHEGKSHSIVGVSEQAAGFDEEAVKSAKKNLKKSATFPCSTEPSADVHHCIGNGELSGTNIQNHQSKACQASTYARSVSLPGTSTLVPAIKGGRAKNGMPSTVELHVKWAPEVYDPPVTSVSHTLPKNYQPQRLKSKKKEKGKQKRQKNRSSAGNGSNKKNRGCVVQNSPPTDIGNLEDEEPVAINPVVASLGLDTLGKQKTKVLSYGIGGQEAKCGSSFLQEAAGRMHLTIGEAS